MAKRIKFLDLLPIYRAMEGMPNAEYRLQVTNEVLLKSLVLALDDSNVDESGISVRQGDYQNIKLNDVFQLDVSQPRIGLGILSRDFSTYISSTIGARIKERDNFYLIADGFFSADEKIPVVVNKYRQVLRLVSLLGESAHYLDVTKEEMVFYKDGRFVVPVIYGMKEIEALDFSVFEKLEKFVLDPYHKDQKIKMLSENIIEMLALIPIKERFSFLVNNLDDLFGRLRAGYNLFASDYTYEKALTEVHAFKVDVVTKIHKAIADIQAQVLGIPIATFIALSQLKKTTSLNAQFAANTAIFAGVTVFCFLLIGFLMNQRSTLKTIDGEVKRQRKVFEKRFEEKKVEYLAEFKSIEDRLWWQCVAVKAIFLLDAIMFVWSFVYYVVHTRPIYDFLF